jgi:hypothetical protein
MVSSVNFMIFASSHVFISIQGEEFEEIQEHDNTKSRKRPFVYVSLESDMTQ